MSPSVCRDPQEEVGPLEHPSCPALEVLQPGRGIGRGVFGCGPLTPPSRTASDSTNSSENMYTVMNPIGPGAGRANVSWGLRGSGWGRRGGGPRPKLLLCLQFPLGPGPEAPMAAMSAMEPHHVNGSLGEWAESRDTQTPTHTPPPSCFASLVRPLAAPFSPSASVLSRRWGRAPSFSGLSDWGWPRCGEGPVTKPGGRPAAGTGPPPQIWALRLGPPAVPQWAGPREGPRPPGKFGKGSVEPAWRV